MDINEDLAVHTAWDFGIDERCAIWCFQIELGRVNVVDYYESSGHGLDHYVEWLNENGYRGVDWVPHDARIREFSTGRTRLEYMLALGRKPRVVPQHKLADGIQAARLTLPLAHFDAGRCGSKGLHALREYKAEWDEDLRTFKRTPKHDWASHGADAFRYLSMAWQEPLEDDKPDFLKQLIAEMTRKRTLNELLAEYDDQMAEMEN